MNKQFKNITYASIAALFSCSILANTAAASKNSDTHSTTVKHHGFYFDVDGGWGYMGVNNADYSDPLAGTPPNSLVNNSVAWSVDVGLQLNQYIAIEGGYISFGTARIDTTYSSIEDNFGGFYAALKGIEIMGFS